MTQPLTTPNTSAPPMAPVLLVNFIGTLGYTIAIPFLVFLVTRLGGDAVIYGVVAACYSTFQFFGAPILGRWSDRYGRRKILLLSQLGTLISWLIFGAALYLPTTELASIGAGTLTLPLVVIMFARALDGLTGGNISVANAYVADISTDATRSRNFGRMGVASNLGMVLGPALAGVLGSTAMGEALPIFGAALIALVGAGFILFWLPESRKPVDDECKQQRLDAVQALGQETLDCLQARKRQSTLSLLKRGPIAFVIALNFIVMAGFSFFYTAFPMNASTRLGWSAGEMGAFFAVLSFMLVVVQGPVLAWLSTRTSERTLITSGLMLLAVNFGLMQSPETWVLYIAAALFALGNGIMWPSLVSTVAAAAGDELQGAVQGLAGSAGSLASIFGLLLGGVAYTSMGPMTFNISAGLMLLAFYINLVLPKMLLRRG
ncbi:MAG: MFS transporter [Bradymonadia bacterium]